MPVKEPWWADELLDKTCINTNINTNMMLDVTVDIAMDQGKLKEGKQIGSALCLALRQQLPTSSH